MPVGHSLPVSQLDFPSRYATVNVNIASAYETGSYAGDHHQPFLLRFQLRCCRFQLGRVKEIGQLLVADHSKYAVFRDEVMKLAVQHFL